MKKVVTMILVAAVATLAACTSDKGDSSGDSSVVDSGSAVE
jgi:hypothetical protein